MLLRGGGGGEIQLYIWLYVISCTLSQYCTSLSSSSVHLPPAAVYIFLQQQCTSLSNSNVHLSPEAVYISLQTQCTPSSSSSVHIHQAAVYIRFLCLDIPGTRSYKKTFLCFPVSVSRPNNWRCYNNRYWRYIAGGFYRVWHWKTDPQAPIKGQI